MASRPYAVFDIDGTLIRWQLYHAMADTLAKQGTIDKNEYKNVLLARRNWKSRRSSNSFIGYENSLIHLIEKYLPGLDYALFTQACADVVVRYQDQVYTFTRDLIAELRQQNFLTFAISTSPAELVSKVSAHYSFDDFAGSAYEVKQGKMTGNSTLLLGQAKARRLRELVKEYGATSKGSVAVGDTPGDIPMLELAERPIAFNPSLALLKEATKRGWEVVVERKNVVYNLQYNHGSYILTPPDDRQTLIF